MKRLFFSLLFLFLLLNSGVAEAKFVRVYRDEGFDMYINTASIVKNQGVYSFWIKSMYSDDGKAMVRKEMPQKLRKQPIEYGMDYFVYDTNKGRYQMKLCSVWSPDDKEIFRQGSQKWLPLKAGTLAELMAATIVELKP